MTANQVRQSNQRHFLDSHELMRCAGGTMQLLMQLQILVEAQCSFWVLVLRLAVEL